VAVPVSYSGTTHTEFLILDDHTCANCGRNGHHEARCQVVRAPEPVTERTAWNLERGADPSLGEPSLEGHDSPQSRENPPVSIQPSLPHLAETAVHETMGNKVLDVVVGPSRASKRVPGSPQHEPAKRLAGSEVSLVGESEVQPPSVGHADETSTLLDQPGPSSSGRKCSLQGGAGVRPRRTPRRLRPSLRGRLRVALNHCHPATPCSTAPLPTAFSQRR
jgi:hypothetical protein